MKIFDETGYYILKKENKYYNATSPANTLSSVNDVEWNKKAGNIFRLHDHFKLFKRIIFYLLLQMTNRFHQKSVNNIHQEAKMKYLFALSLILYHTQIFF
jgi:hypothetical protein